MRVAFYCPMKPPDHPNPSGDRLMARNLMSAIRRAGHEVILVSKLRTRDGTGDPARQKRFQRIGAWYSERLIRRFSSRPPDVWLTYHLYYKAVDWIGPATSEKLGIPYAVAEASFAPKRANGPWAFSHAAVARAIERAKLFIYPNPIDLACAAPLLGEDTATLALPPFIELPDEGNKDTRSEIALQYGLDPALPWILSVGMMRHGDKESSYKVAADVLSRLDPGRFQHVVIGDGAARSGIQDRFQRLPTTFVGELDEQNLHAFYRATDIFFWPAVNEAWGMVILEAQSHGLPVVVGDSGGVPNVVANGETGLLCELDDLDEFARALDRLIQDRILREDMGSAARAYVAERHGIDAAAASLGKALVELET